MRHHFGALHICWISHFQSDPSIHLQSAFADSHSIFLPDNLSSIWFQMQIEKLYKVVSYYHSLKCSEVYDNYNLQIYFCQLFYTIPLRQALQLVCYPDSKAHLRLEYIFDEIYSLKRRRKRMHWNTPYPLEGG